MHASRHAAQPHPSLTDINEQPQFRAFPDTPKCNQNTGTTQQHASNLCSAGAPNIPVCRGRIATCAHQAIEQVEAIQAARQQPAAARCVRRNTVAAQHCTPGYISTTMATVSANTTTTHAHMHCDVADHQQQAAMHLVRAAAMTKRCT